MDLIPGKRFAVFSIRKMRHGGVLWTRAGNASFSKDGSLTIWLDVLPMDGQLHVRELPDSRHPLPDPRARQPQDEHEPAPPLLDSAAAGAAL